MRYAKKAMIVAPQPEPTEAGADVLREGGNAVDAGIACALVQGVVDPHDVRHRGLRLVRHLHAGQEVPRLHRRPCAGAARRAARHVGQPDRERGARRLRLHPARAGSTTSATSRSARRRTSKCTTRRTRSTAACRGRASSSPPSPGPRAAGPCGRTSTTGGRTTAPSAARPITSAPASRRPPARSTAGPTAAPSGSATASSTATTARPCAPSPRMAPTSSIPARSRRRSPRT